MGISGQLHTPAVLLLTKEASVPMLCRGGGLAWPHSQSVLTWTC